MSPERPGSTEDESNISHPRMSVPGSPIALTPMTNAQSPISILLAVAQSQKGPDDDLTSLSWLHEGDVLKGTCAKLTCGLSHSCYKIKYILSESRESCFILI